MAASIPPEVSRRFTEEVARQRAEDRVDAMVACQNVAVGLYLELEIAREEATRLRAAVKRYGLHRPDCAWGDSACSCGFRAALARER